MANETRPIARPLAAVTALAKKVTGGSGPSEVTSDKISDATSLGRKLLKAASAAAARADIGAGTSDLTLGTTATTAAKGDHKHSFNDLTDKPTIPSVSGLAKEADLTALADRVTALETPGE